MTTYQPNWASDLSEKYGASIAHAFLLHGNTQDFAVPGLPLETALINLLHAEITVVYDIAEGFSFPFDSGQPEEPNKRAFLQALGLEATQNRPQAQAAGVIMGQQGPMQHNPGVALMLITRLLRCTADIDADLAKAIAAGEASTPKKAAVIVKNADLLFPAGNSGNAGDRINLATALTWGRDKTIAASANVVCLITQNLADIHSNLQSASSRIELIEMCMPDYNERLHFIDWYKDTGSFGFSTEMSDHQIAALTSGLQCLHIEDIFMRADEVGWLDAAHVAARKQEIIKSEYGEVLEVWYPRFGFDHIGGLQWIKDYFETDVIAPMLSGDSEMKSIVPMGVLFAGAPGTGKSIMAEAIAFEAKINAVKVNLRKLRDKYVGSTGRNQEKLFRALRAFAPCVVFLDEIDQQMGRGGADSHETEKGMFAGWLEFIGDTSHRGDIIFLAATNRPDYIDGALKRPGRFDVVQAFTVPAAEERASIAAVMASKAAQRTFVTNDITAAYLDNTDKWTGAYIERSANKAKSIMYKAGQTLETCTAADFIQFMTEASTKIVVPDQRENQLFEDLAIAAVNDIDYLPPQYRAEIAENRAEVDARITEALEVERRTGGRKL